MAVEDHGMELRTYDIGGDMTAGFVRLPAGADLRPSLIGMPDDLCPCPHWGYVLSGRLRMHTATGAETYEAGDAFYWSSGHAPEALEDSEYVDFSPARAFAPVVEHMRAS